MYKLIETMTMKNIKILLSISKIGKKKNTKQRKIKITVSDSRQFETRFYTGDHCVENLKKIH